MKQKALTSLIGAILTGIFIGTLWSLEAQCWNCAPQACQRQLECGSGCGCAIGPNEQWGTCVSIE